MTKAAKVLCRKIKKTFPPENFPIHSKSREVVFTISLFITCKMFSFYLVLKNSLFAIFFLIAHNLWAGTRSSTLKIFIRQKIYDLVERYTGFAKHTTIHTHTHNRKFNRCAQGRNKKLY